MAKSLAEHIAEVRRKIPVDSSSQLDGLTKAINESVDLSTFSPVSSEASAIVNRMLEGVPEEEIFRAQVFDLMSRTDCDCGCPSLRFAVSEVHARATLRRNLLSEMTGEASDGLVGLILWQAGGKLTGLEVYDLAGREGRYGLPALDTLQSF